MDLTLVILAAGIGSRYGGIKQLDSVGPNGETIMDYSIHDAIKAGFTNVVFIIRKDRRSTREGVGSKLKSHSILPSGLSGNSIQYPHLLPIAPLGRVLAKSLVLSWRPNLLWKT